MKIKTARDAGKEYPQKSLRAFLEGKSNEKWAEGILRASMPEDIQEALKSLSFYGNTTRFDFLRRACGVA
mgnify:CR=1 FL=1